MEYGTVALYLGAILFVVGALTKASKTRKKMFTIGFIVGAIGLIPVVLPGTIPFLDNEIDFGGSSLAISSGGGGLVNSFGVCPPGQQVEDTTVTLSAVDKYTSASTGGTHRYMLNGAPALTVANGGTFTASPGDKYKILWTNGTEGSYSSAVSEGTIPCVGTYTIAEDLIANGSTGLTIEVFNEEGNLIDSANENETLAAGDVVTLEAKLKGQYQKGYPYGGVMVVEFNGTGANSNMDDVIIDFGGTEVNVPSFYVIVYGAASKTKAYSIPPILSNQILEGTIVLDADDTNNPEADSHPRLNFYPYDYYIDEKDGGMFKGPSVEDENGNQVKGLNHSFTLQID